MDITVIPLQEKDLKPLFTNPEDLGFGRVFTDRMFTMEYTEGHRLAEPDHPEI